jgi:GH24 family phage-related lysozyme (muramidase)
MPLNFLPDIFKLGTGDPNQEPARRFLFGDNNIAAPKPKEGSVQKPAQSDVEQANSGASTEFKLEFLTEKDFEAIKPEAKATTEFLTETEFEPLQPATPHQKEVRSDNPPFQESVADRIIDKNLASSLVPVDPDMKIESIEDIFNKGKKVAASLLRTKPKDSETFTKQVSAELSKTKDITNDKQLFKQISIHEGVRNTVYKDTKGIPTIGVGFNLTRKDAREKVEALGVDYDKVRAGKESLTEDQIFELYKNDIQTAISDAKSIVSNFDDLDRVRQRVMVDMAFNLGHARFSEFKATINAVERFDFEKAAEQMINSLWFDQVKTRGVRLVKMMRDGIDLFS